MCNIGGGANRCDAHWGESQKAADLAKRRAKYAALKGGTVRQYTHKEATSLIAEAKTSLESAEHFKIKAISDTNHLVRMPKGSSLAPKLKINGEQEYNEKLNLYTVPLAGSFVEDEYYADRTISGVINWNNLDEESYKEFGFTHPSEERGTRKEYQELSQRSTQEFASFSDENANALEIFTTRNYTWINEALFNRKKDNTTCISPVEGQNVSLARKKIIKYSEETAAQLTEVVKQMDGAMAKSVGQQRIVYRGMARKNLGNYPDGTSLDEIIENYKVGQELTFDGYQSASYDPTIAVRFGHAKKTTFNNQGIVCEILTSSGVNVASRSEYTSEKEVTLPRNARYMIVGVHKDSKYVAHHVGENKVHSTEKFEGVYVVQLVEITETGEITTSENRPKAPPALTPIQLLESKE